MICNVGHPIIPLLFSECLEGMCSVAYSGRLLCQGEHDANPMSILLFLHESEGLESGYSLLFCSGKATLPTACKYLFFQSR